eukprot:COSAG02_NODE_20552_length_826_cov_0.852820_1_plen_140_part_10
MRTAVLLAGGLAVHAMEAAQPVLEVYPAPAPGFPKGPFTVTVSQQAAGESSAGPRDSFVYMTQQGGRSQSFTTFSFEGGAVTVAVTPTAKNWTSCVLRPVSLGLTAQRGPGGATVFSIPAAPAKVIVEFESDVSNTLAVF